MHKKLHAAFICVFAVAVCICATLLKNGGKENETQRANVQGPRQIEQRPPKRTHNNFGKFRNYSLEKSLSI